MQDLYHNILPVRALRPQTISTGVSPDVLVSGAIDLLGYFAAQIVVDFGDIDELGASPVGSARIDVRLEHADDDGTGAPDVFSNVALDDVIGPTSVTTGIVASVTTDATLVRVGYRGERRFLRVSLVPTALPNGGPVAAWVELGHPRHAPAS